MFDEVFNEVKTLIKPGTQSQKEYDDEKELILIQTTK